GTTLRAHTTGVRLATAHPFPRVDRTRYIGKPEVPLAFGVNGEAEDPRESGVLFMPILLYGYGLSVRNAAGTGVLLLFVTVAIGTLEQAVHGYVSLKLAMAILIGSSVGSQLGALTTHYLPNRILRFMFGVLVAATVVMIVWDLARLLQL